MVLALIISNADNLRVLGLIVLALIGIRQWLKNSLQSRGRAQTIALVARISISAFTGACLSLVALLLAKSCPRNAWCSVPMTPGFLIGALTPFVGVHRDDNLLWYVTAVLNATIYGLIAFGIYPLFGREKKST